MDNKIRQRNEEALAELGEMFKKARPIREIWNRARGEIQALSNKELAGLVLESAESMHGGPEFPALPQRIMDLAKLHDIWLREVVGLTEIVTELAEKSKKTLNEAVLTASESFPPQLAAETRLGRLLARLAYMQSRGEVFSRNPSDPVRRATEAGFEIVAKRMIENCLSEGLGLEAAAEKVMAASRRITNTNPRYARTNEWVELQVQLLREEFVCKANQSANKDGLAVDAPAFEKRSVQGPRTPNGKTPKPIKR